MALSDQLVCELHDCKTRKELHCIKDLIIRMVIDKARAAETVNCEA